ncbi:MAG: phosphopantetheine-binding protein [Gammaproteobacteria bacterium]|nr:phosphopantetheine-binding protein [Gammaproteobacteria bacterium]MCW8987906.1 phosphopantetheine-binding protein [Gammaproteobacteria bacterium]MCW9029976.1 phosphopantetheine-binding protein [Gammaproteobacteria bacterium]
MSDLSPTEREVANLIIDSLALEDISAADIAPGEALFNDGLGLDSIDALELAMAISQQYGFQLKSDDPNNAKIFSSLRELTNHIEAQRQN